MPYTTWNPADLSNTSLTGGNLTATFTATGVSNAVRSVFGASTGKWYFELTCNSPTNSAMGLALSSVSYSSLGTIGVGGGGAAGSVAYMQSAYLYVGTSLVLNFGSGPPNGAVVQFAFDLGAKLIWVRINAGTWNNSGTANPATAAGGVDISSVTTGALYAFGAGQQGSGYTANFGDSAFSYAAPAGFTAGFGVGGGGGAAQARVCIMA